MSTNYKKITDLTRLQGDLLPNDMILIARTDVTDIGYSTYKMLFQTLSSSLVNSIKHDVLSIALLTSMNQLSPTASLSAIAGNVGWRLSTEISQAHSKNTEQHQEIQQLSTVIDSHWSQLPNKVVEYSPTQVISNTSPLTWNYNIKKSTSKVSVDMTDYYAQGITLLDSKNISVDLNEVKTGPLVHIVSKDSTIVISQTKCGSTLYVFINSKIASPLTIDTKKQIKANQEDVYKEGWNCIGHFSRTSDILHFNCKKGTCICLYNGANSTNAEYAPKYSANIDENTNIIIKEFS